MFINCCGDFLENRTGFSSVVQCFVQRVREQLFPDPNIFSRESPWFGSSTIVLECQRVPMCRCRETLRDWKQEDRNGFVPIFRHVHPFPCVVSPCNTPHVRYPSLHFPQVVLENLGSAHERDDRANLASHQQLSRQSTPLLKSTFVTGRATRETGDKNRVIFLQVAQHWNTDTLEQFEWEDITSNAPEMPHQEDSECGIGTRNCGRLSWRNR